MKIMRIDIRLIWVGILLTVAGCSGDTGGLKLVTVKGNVTVGDVEPFAKGLVIFTPKQGEKYLGGSAVTDEKGNYVMRHATQRAGIEPGQYDVSFSLFRLPDGSSLPDQSNVREKKSPQELGGVQFVPPEYLTFGSTKNNTVVPAAGGRFDFDIPELKAPSSK